MDIPTCMRHVAFRPQMWFRYSLARFQSHTQLFVLQLFVLQATKVGCGTGNEASLLPSAISKDTWEVSPHIIDQQSQKMAIFYEDLCGLLQQKPL